MAAEIRIPYKELVTILEDVLVKHGYSADRAARSATLFASASLDGVASHGVNRFPLMLKMIRNGIVNPAAEPVRIHSSAIFEKWDGQLGPGDLNATHCMNRAIGLAKTNGLGCVALRNTNHWMRGGNYGWQAVEEGCIGICFTNTKPNMPAWGSGGARGYKDPTNQSPRRGVCKGQ
ncbi:MAG: Ldh family oxidoreductase [Balneolaceae bacterium]